MNHEGNTFSPQLPESFEYAAGLYESHREFRASLEKIANHIVGNGSPMTFALYGEWGTGKSTALEYLQGLIRKREKQVTFSWCQAPLWARYQDERSALALQILRGVERGIPASVADMLAGLLQYDLGIARGHSESDDYELAASLALLKVLESVPHAPPVVEQWIRRYISRNGQVRHVVMLDDLDRCDPEFVSRLLKATNHWTTEIEHGEHGGASIYFILACQEDFLIGSQAKGEVKDPRQSLDKYVHVTVNIPRLLSRPADAAGYLHMLVNRLTGLPEAARDQLAAMIDVSAHDYPDGVFAPLLRVSGLTTPRAIKTRLNLALTEIDYERLDDETLVKEWVIKAFWPDFWANQYRTLVTRVQDPAPTDQQQSGPGQPGSAGAKSLPSDLLTAKFQPIQVVGSRLRGLLDMSDEAMTEALAHVGTEVQADLTDVRPQLAIYLAANPPWPTGLSTLQRGGLSPDAHAAAGRSTAEKSEGERTQRQYVPPDLLIRDSAPPDTSQESQSAPGPVGADLPSDPDDQIFYYFLAADAAEDRADHRAVLENLSQLLGIARAVGSSTGRGADIGNAALIADRERQYEIAYELHHLALAAEPNHFNIMQNYIDFVLDRQLSTEYDEARRLYQILITDGKEHWPLRTLIIGFRLDALSGDSIPNLTERVSRLLPMLREEPSTNRLIDIANIPGESFGYDNVRSACRVVAVNSRNFSNRVTALLIFTAAMGRSRNPAHEREVVDASRWLIGTGLACLGAEDSFANALYNLSIQLGSLGYRAAATLGYAEAYRIKPTSPEYRRALASSLERMDRSEDATAVLLGRPVNTEDIQPEDLPECLSAVDTTNRWWEELPIEKTPPCRTKLTWLIPRGMVADQGRASNGS